MISRFRGYSACYLTCTVVSLFKTSHGTKKMWSYIACGLKIKVISCIKLPLWTKLNGLIIKDGLIIEGCKIERLL